jgi:hypothetical protein
MDRNMDGLLSMPIQYLLERVCGYTSFVLLTGSYSPYLTKFIFDFVAVALSATVEFLSGSLYDAGFALCRNRHKGG